jgi:hypothetical protein
MMTSLHRDKILLLKTNFTRGRKQKSFTISDVFVKVFSIEWGETVHLVRQPLFGLLYQPQMIDECGAVGMRIGRGNPEKTCSSTLCPS